MFSGLSDTRKAGIFTALVLAMATAAALFIRALRMPAGPVPAAIYMFVPAIATLITPSGRPVKMPSPTPNPAAPSSALTR